LGLAIIILPTWEGFMIRGKLVAITASFSVRKTPLTLVVGMAGTVEVLPKEKRASETRLSTDN
jgi:hypothetical protein